MPRHRDRSQDRPTGLLAFLTGAVVIGVVALGLSVANAIAISDAADEREAERVAADVTACERGNQLRHQLVGIAEAQQQLIVNILETAYEDQDIDPEERFGFAFAAYAERLAQVELVDCVEDTPGATSTSLPEDP